MTANPVTIDRGATLGVARRTMQLHGIRHLPVLDDGRLVGIVSLGDLAAAGTPEAGEALETISTPAEPDR